MWALDASALELIFPAAAVCAVLLRMLRIGGKRTVGQFTPFDLLVVMLVSEAAGPSMTGKGPSFGGGCWRTSF